MTIRKSMHAFIVACTTIAMAMPQLAVAEDKNVTPELGIPVIKKVQDIALQANGILAGAVVDANGRPIKDAPVVVAQNGKPIAKIRTTDDGRFSTNGLKPGLYQVASHGGVGNYRVWDSQSAPVSAKQGVIHVANPQIARGAAFDKVVTVLSNPLVPMTVVGGAVALPLVLTNSPGS